MEVENKHLFLSIVSSLICEDTYKEKEPFILTEDGKELKASTYLVIITDILGIDLNSKKILTLAIEKLNKICLSDENITNEIDKANSQLSERVTELINELNSDFVISNQWSLAKYLKAFDFAVDTESITSSFDQIIQYLQLASDFLKGNIICFVNLKSFFTEVEIAEIYKFSVYNKVRILLLEPVLSDIIIEYERKLIIDSEFDEFVIK